MSVQSEIDRIITAVGNAYSKVSEKGGTVPASQTVANLATAIDSIPAGGGIGEIFSGEVIPTKETPPSELLVTLPNGEQMTISDLWSSKPADIWNKIVLNGSCVSFFIFNTTDSHVYTGTQIKHINIDFYIYTGTKRNRRWRRCLNGASDGSIADTLCFKTGSKYVYYWI